MQKFLKVIAIWFFLLVLPGEGRLVLYSQTVNCYGLAVTTSMNDYLAEVRLDSNMQLLNIASEVPGVLLDIRYATPDNFLGFPFYDTAVAFARKPVVEALRKVQDELFDMGLGLCIFDAYRPYSVTVMLYEKTMDSVFVAVPWKGSRHNRGCAVDVTLIDLNTGTKLPMPTLYDDFSEKANPEYSDLPSEILANREKLIGTMEKHGFTVYFAEWWHFDYMGWERYSLLDIPFDSLVTIY